MNKLRINALLACLLLAMVGSLLANDPPKEAPKDAKKDEDKPAEPDLPSKPYPKNAVPKAFLPKSDEKKEAAANRMQSRISLLKSALKNLSISLMKNTQQTNTMARMMHLP